MAKGIKELLNTNSSISEEVKDIVPIRMENIQPDTWYIGKINNVNLAENKTQLIVSFDVYDCEDDSKYYGTVNGWIKIRYTVDSEADRFFQAIDCVGKSMKNSLGKTCRILVKESSSKSSEKKYFNAVDFDTV